MKYSIVIPTYNHCDDLLKPCIDSIFKYTDVTDIELIISANGCIDNTFEYCNQLRQKYDSLGLYDNLKIVWNDPALGYSRACNAGIEVATCPLIVLLNNDTVLLEQNKNRWLDQLATPFQTNEKCGISCLIKSHSEPAGHDFAIFFCVMIHRKVFDKIGLLSLDYGAGGGEDTEFSIECERAGFEVLECVNKQWNPQIGMFSGDFPIYHLGEGTVHDKNLVPEWDDIFLTNSLTLAKKYNPHWYQWRLSNYWERAVFFKGDQIAPREITRYSWAAQNILGKKVFELGCSSGYGVQFLPENIEYTGLDYDKRIIPVAREQKWRDKGLTFVHGDINTYELDQYDTIIAFEVIEHLDNGLEIVEKLKKHCKRLMITVPMLETPGLWGPHHKIHNLDESFFPGFRFKFIAPDGSLRDEPHNRGDKENINLMLCVWDRDDVSQHRPATNQSVENSLRFLIEQDPAMYREVIEANQYHLTPERVKDRIVVDVGANIGAFSLYAAALGAKKVIAVEPISASYNTFLKNIHRMGLTNITTYKKIVAERGNQFLPVSLNANAGANSMYNVSDNYEVVETITFDEIMDQIAGHDILLKLDCEGGEYDVIMNISSKNMVRINEIMLEIHTDLHPKYKGKQILEEKLKDFNFKQLDSTQIYYWDFDQNGQPINYREAPFVNQHWKK